MSTAPHDGTSVIEQLAACAAAESFERLPADVIAAARLAILDTVPDVSALARLMRADAR